MKQVTLFLLLSVALINVKAQDTSSVCMPSTIAKQVAQDLIIGDSAKALLEVTMDELDLVNQKLSYKDSMLFAAKLKEINYIEQVRNEQNQKAGYITQYNNCKDEFKALAKKEKITRIKSKLKSILGVPVIIALGILYLLK